VNGPGAVSAILAVASVIAGQVLLKQGMTDVGPIGRERLKSPLRLAADVASQWRVWVGLAVYVFSAAVWIFALARLPLAVAYSFLALSYVGVSAVAVMRFDESLTPAQWVGVAVAVCGVVLVAVAG
jgi:multidrug transporter EmrE-like cation transporter